jgi:hypothetical protein
MADHGPPSTGQSCAETGELVLFGTVGDVRPNVFGAAMFLALVVGDGWTSALLLRRHTGAVLHAGVAAAVVIGLSALWLLRRGARLRSGRVGLECRRAGDHLSAARSETRQAMAKWVSS